METNIDKVIGLINQLPPMPDNITKLRRLCADPNVRFKDFVPLIEGDPGLCADILHMANSAYFGVGHSVESISEAVRYFGMTHLVDFISISFSDKVIKHNFSDIENLNEYFKHSRIVSLATKIVAKVAGKSTTEQEFFSIAGLLHDIGRLIVIVAAGKDRLEVKATDWMFIEDQVKKEELLLGMDHTIVGEKICEKWDFSSTLQKAVRRHHVPFDDTFYEEAAFIFIAHFTAMSDFPIDMVYTALPENIMLELNLTKDKLVEARCMIEENLSELGLHIN